MDDKTTAWNDVLLATSEVAPPLTPTEPPSAEPPEASALAPHPTASEVGAVAVEGVEGEATAADIPAPEAAPTAETATLAAPQPAAETAATPPPRVGEGAGGAVQPAVSRATAPRITAPNRAIRFGRPSTQLTWQIGRAHRIRVRLLRRFQARPKRWPWVVGISLGVLVAFLVPSLLAVASAIQDYTALKALGQDGLHHLLAAKDDLASMASLGKELSLGSGGGGAAGDAPYTLVVQRQAGTYNTTQITIQPSPKMQKAGIKTTNYSTTSAGQGANATITVGAKPTPTPTPTPKPTATQPPGPQAKGGSTASSSLFPDPALLKDAQTQLQLAQQDFLQLKARLGHLGWAVSGAQHLPPVGSQIDTVGTLADIGYNAATVGQMYMEAAIPLLTKLHGKSLSGDSPLLTQSDITTLQKTITQSQPLFATLQADLMRVNVGDLPLSDAQKAEFASVKAELPKLHDGLQQANQWIGALGWMLGTDAPRNFLVQTLDRSELRASGGFAGDFGILTIRNGQVLPFSLTTVERTDYSYGKWYNGWVYGRRPPAAYSWWPIANWGLRDANLSADFPTNAKMIMQVWSNECGAACQAAGAPAKVDGVINFTPTAIADLLKATGPLVIPQYGEVITAQNLEDKIHYYQLSPEGLAKQIALSPNEDATSARKAFTHLVAQMLEERVKHLPQNQLMPVARQIFEDIQAKNVQIYVSNTTVENLLLKEHAGGAIETTKGVDGFMVVQVNVSAAKATPCVTTTQKDNVTLDDKGGATHRLTVSMYHVIGACDPYPGEFSTYHAYMRVYAPAQAHLLSADGFDQNQPLCAANCSPNPYPDGELVCQPGGYNPGVHTNNILPMGAEAGVLDKLGGPTQTTSDVPGRAMWGGFVVIPPYCTANLTLSWYVPGMVRG